MKLLPSIYVAFACCALLGAQAQAQGSDDCATATPISGTGSFAVNTVGSTDSPQQTGSCVTIHHDV